MGNLTVKQIENAKPQDKPYKLMDGDGLQLRVAVDGVKTWLVRYMFDGKERQYRLPELYGEGEGRLGLKDAREEATHIRALARKGTRLTTMQMKSVTHGTDWVFDYRKSFTVLRTFS